MRQGLFEQPFKKFLLRVEEEVIQIGVGEGFGKGSAQRGHGVAPAYGHAEDDRDLVGLVVERINSLDESLRLQTLTGACPNDGTCREVVGEDDGFGGDGGGEDAFHCGCGGGVGISVQWVIPIEGIPQSA